jgi:hypothetical protein
LPPRPRSSKPPVFRGSIGAPRRRILGKGVGRWNSTGNLPLRFSAPGLGFEQAPHSMDAPAQEGVVEDPAGACPEEAGTRGRALPLNTLILKWLRG